MSVCVEDFCLPYRVLGFIPKRNFVWVAPAIKRLSKLVAKVGNQEIRPKSGCRNRLRCALPWGAGGFGEGDTQGKRWWRAKKILKKIFACGALKRARKGKGKERQGAKERKGNAQRKGKARRKGKDYGSR